MNSPQPMLSVSDALDRLLQSAADSNFVSGRETVPTLHANGRVLAEPITATINVPALDNSQMDGYAVRSADCTSNLRLPVAQRIAAGQIGQPLQPGTAARIFTGAPIPAGADAVVMQEECAIKSNGAGECVTLSAVPPVGQWIRRVGEDIAAGHEILAAGTRLRPQHLGLAASVGRAQLSVHRPLKVAIFFTGDELTMPGELLKPGAIYNSNRFVLHTLLQQLGCAVSDYGNVPDSLAATRATLRKAAAQHDLIVTSGGVSVGEEDHVKPALQAEGTLSIWKIAMKPGKPLAFGSVRRGDDRGNAFFLGLPGNPVSSLVTFLLLVRPFVLRLQGMTDVMPKALPLRADFDWPQAGRRNEFLRARINLEGGLDLFPNQGSAVLTSTVWGDGLIDNPADCIIKAGDLVRFLPFNELIF